MCGSFIIDGKLFHNRGKKRKYKRSKSKKKRYPQQ